MTTITIDRRQRPNIAGRNVIFRKAVRAIIKENNKFLMVLSNRMGDYKFPGGGLELNESDENALIREVEEETGYVVNQIRSKIIKVDEIQNDKENDEGIFHMESIYYLCTIEKEKKVQNLDKYEEELGFEAQWINLDEVLKINRIVLNNPKSSKWVEREIRVLEKLIELGI